MAERVYALRDTDTSFHDPETGFKLLRDQQKPLGNKVGKATARAVQHGRIIEVRQPVTALMRREGNQGKGSESK